MPYDAAETRRLVSAARELLPAGGDDGGPLRLAQLARGRPPLVILYLATCWKVFGESTCVARASLLVFAAFALGGLFRLAAQVANRRVASAAVICTALYPAFYAESVAAHTIMAATAFTLWGLLFYLPPKNRGARAVAADSSPPAEPNWQRRRLACGALFALGAMANSTVVLAPLALLASEVWQHRRGVEAGHATVLRHAARRSRRWSLAPLALALAPLLVWLIYSAQGTTDVFGISETARGANVEQHLLLAIGIRIWQVTAYGTLYVLTVPALLLMVFAQPVREGEGAERGRIDVGVQVMFAFVVAAYTITLSLKGGAIEARDMLPTVPLVILVCVSTIWRRVRYWQFCIAAICAALALGIFAAAADKSLQSGVRSRTLGAESGTTLGRALDARLRETPYFLEIQTPPASYALRAFSRAQIPARAARPAHR